MERIFTLSMSAASQLHVFPDDVQTQLDSYSFAFGALRELDTVDNINPISLLVSANTYIYGTILANQLKTYGQDPPDPNFQSVYLANVVMSSSLPTTGNAQLDIALRNALGASAKASAYLKAVNASFDKYAGAVDAGDNIHAALQLEAILNYLKLYNEAAQDAALQLKQTQSLMTSLGLAGGTYDPQTLIDLQSQITANGLPSDITNVLTQLGLTSNQMYQVKQSILGMDPNAISGTFADASNMASITLLQGTTAAVPEPSSWAMLAMGAGSILAFRYRRGRA